jgi:hypothetical protein
MKILLRVLFWASAALLSSPAFAQTLSGRVTDSKTGESLPGVLIRVKQLNRATLTDEKGEFEIKNPKGWDSLEVEFSFLGYAKTTKIWYGEKLLVSMLPSELSLDEVVIESESYKDIVNSSQMGKTSLPIEDAKLIPAVFGEVDILKVLQLKPGVQSGGEGSSGLFVRGGGPDQNLILMDGAQVYNAAHLFGFFSIFNSDAVKDVDLYKSGFPAQYGGRLSSVIDVKMRQSQSRKFKAQGGIGLISSRLTLEVPLLKKTKTTLVLSGRRTYVDVFTRAVNRYFEGDPSYEPIPDYAFHDLNAKASFELSPKDLVVVSAYWGRDNFLFRNNLTRFNFIWGNDVANVSWFRRKSEKALFTYSLSHSRYRYELRNRFDIFGFSIGSFISDWQLRSEAQIETSGHSIKIGASATHHSIELGRISAGAQDGSFNINRSQPYQALEYGLFYADDWDWKKFKFNYGARISAFSRDRDFFWGLEPRLSSRYQASEDFSLKAAFTRMFQYLHLVSNTGATLPTDLWYPSGGITQPQISDQVSMGGSWLLSQGNLLLTSEVYYKNFQRQIDFKDGAQIFFNPEIDKEFVFGNGYAYGNEIYLEKKRGKIRGWLGYTLSWTLRRFPQINGGRLFPPRNDQRHNISVVGIYSLNKRVTLSATWVYNTGNAISLPIGRFLIQNTPGADPIFVPIFTDRNAYRMASYHRLDLGLTLKFFRRWGESDLTFNVFNAYDRRNPFFIYFEEVKDEISGQTVGFEARQVSLFPILPSITYNFKF